MRKKFTMLFAALLACVGVMKAEVTDLPQISTVENPIYYTIYNTRSQEPGGLMYYAGDNVGLKDGLTSATLEDKYKFFFTGSHEAMYIHNAATGKKLASVDSWTDEGIEWTVSAPTNNGLAFGPKGQTGNVFWNDKNYSVGENTSDFTVWGNTDAGSIFVVELAENFVFPVSDKFYTIECPLFENVQGVKKGLMVNADGSLGWNTVDLTNKNCYWVLTVNEDGTVVLKNLGTGKYLNGTAMSDDAVNATLNVLGSNFFKIQVNGVTVHANGHSNGTSASGNIVSWNGAAGSASAWRFVERQDPDAVQEVNFTYSFVYEGAEKYSQACKTLAGEEYPAITLALPYGVSVAAKPEGEVTADKDDAKIEIALTIEKELPFVTATDVNSINTWYYAQMHANPKVTAYVEDNKNENNSVEWNDYSVAVEEIESHLWGFVGDVWTGIKMVNKGTGRAIVSTSGNATMGDAPQATAFIPKNSQAGGNWFCLKYPESNDYLNAQGDQSKGEGQIKSWGDNDNGSSFVVAEYEEAEASVSELGWATLYLGYATYIPEGVNAYAVTAAEGGNATLTQLEGVIPANTGVILENAGEFTFKMAAKNVAAVEGSLLRGSVEAEEVTVAENQVAYILANTDSKGVGLYKAALTDGKFTNGANKAYMILDVPAEGQQPAAMFSFGRGEGTTGIEKVELTNEVVVYDLTGRRVQKMEKGIYIVNGKKVFVK